MSGQWSRVGAGIQLFLAIFGDLRRRAWWAYRAHGLHLQRPQTTIVARRPGAAQPAVPLVTGAWKTVVAGALTAHTVTSGSRRQGPPLPVARIDVATRPDIADLPRVLHAEGAAYGDPTLAATQWLADPNGGHAFLIVTFVEPVDCTFALAFDLHEWRAMLERFAPVEMLMLVWEDQEPHDIMKVEDRELPWPGLVLALNRPQQLTAILRHEFRHHRG